ncbi:serine/threonine-protein kinase [Sorangium sp. So ce385]|uniref:serine/threonine-protein kinase n=1 Tax=Sorangium sp. So ce385 TaxID=3133308 RepID=UPI003F5B4965
MQGPLSSTARFTIGRRLGEGAFGVVYEAHDRERGARVALKSLHRLDPVALYRFKREFRALSEVVHPNLVALHELFSEENRWFFTMDLVEGADFLSAVRGPSAQRAPEPSASMRAPAGGDPDETAPVVSSTWPGPVASGGAARDPGDAARDPGDAARDPGDAARDPGDAARDPGDAARGPGDAARDPAAAPPPRWGPLRSALVQLAQGLAALHAAGKLHRDLKPSNVLVTREGRVVILDFGLVTELSTGSIDQSGSHIAGTPAYMAPEQARRGTLSPACDWYAVGVMLYEALTGRRPFEGGALEVIVQKQRDRPPPPSELAEGIPGDLDALCAELLRPDPGERPPAHEVLRRLSPPDGDAEGRARGEAGAPARPRAQSSATPAPGAPFVGREGHLDALRGAFARARGGRATTVHIHGTSGAGKTALVRRFLDELSAAGEAVVLEGRCYERESVPYKAVDSLIDALSRHLARLPRLDAAELMPRDVHAVVRLFPVLGQVDAIARAPRREVEPPDARELRRRGFAALREILARIADRRPLVLFIDDLQWGDADSAALLTDLLREPDAPALLLLLCYRSEDAARSELVARLLPPDAAGADAGDVRALAVGALSPEEGRALALALLGGGDRAAAQADAIAQEAEGNPFFVLELSREVEGRAAPESSRGAGVRLGSVLAGRLQRLPAAARRLLEVVAVSGKPLGRRDAREAAGLTPDEEQAALAALRAASAIRTRGQRDEQELETFHDRIREAALAQLGAAELAAVHLGLAAVLEASGRAEADVLAMHFRRGGRADEAARYAVKAGDRAAEALAFDRAAEHYAAALEAAPAGAADARALRVKLAHALRNAGRGAEAARAYAAAAEGAAPRESLDLRRCAAEQLLVSGHIEEGKRALAGVLATVGMRLAERRWAVLLSLLFWRLLLRLRGFRFRERDARALPAETLTRLDICWSASVGLAMADVLQGAALQARHLFLALRAGEPYRLARAIATEIGHLGTDHVVGRRLAHRRYATAAALAEKVGDPYLVAVNKCMLGVVECLSGRWAEGLALCREAEDLLRARCAGVAWELGTSSRFMMVAHYHRGELDALARLAAPRIADADARGDLYAASFFRVGLTYIVPLAADRPDAARDEVLGAMARWPRRWFDHLDCLETVALGRIDLYAGAPLEARRRIRDRWRKIALSFLPRFQYYRVLIHHLRASAALEAAARAASGDARLARRLLGEAERDARRLSREGAPWVAPMATSLRAAIAAQRGQVAQALSLLEEAAAAFDGCEMALFAACARRRRGQLLGGEEGRALIEAADAWMAGQGIRNPARIAAIFAPGFS